MSQVCIVGTDLGCDVMVYLQPIRRQVSSLYLLIVGMYRSYPKPRVGNGPMIETTDRLSERAAP